MTTNHNRLENLDNIQDKLAESLDAAGQALKELSKDKPNVKTVDSLTSTFMERLNGAGSELSNQIAYLMRVKSGQTTEGASFAKDSKMAQKRLEIARARLHDIL